jgi:hypothetical protein
MFKNYVIILPTISLNDCFENYYIYVEVFQQVKVMPWTIKSEDIPFQNLCHICLIFEMTTINNYDEKLFAIIRQES